MNTRKKFIAQQGSNQTIKVFDAESGSLYRVIATGGEIVSPPYVSGDSVVVGVKSGGKAVSKIFTLPNGSLKSVTQLS